MNFLYIEGVVGGAALRGRTFVELFPVTLLTNKKGFRKEAATEGRPYNCLEIEFQSKLDNARVSRRSN